MKKQLFTVLASIALFTQINAQVQVVTTFAGSGNFGSTDATGIAASFNFPSGVCADTSGNVYVADQSNHKIRMISPTGVVTTIAGSGTSGSTDATGILASFNNPVGVCVDAAGNLYVADQGNQKIRVISPTGVVTTLAGSGAVGSINATGVAASFNDPAGVCVDASGNVYVADQENHKIRKITSAGVVTTFGGTGSIGADDGTITVARFYKPVGVCVDASGNVYVVEYGNHKIRKITPGSVVTTIAGSGTAGLGTPGSTDATGTAASFYNPMGICLDAVGNLYVADQANQKIRMISPTGVVTTLAGSGNSGSIDGIGTAARFNVPVGVCLDAAGNVYVADKWNSKIRKISLCTIPPSPTDTTPLGNTTICVGNTTTLIASGTGTVSWYLTPTSTVSIATGSLIVTSSTLAVGTYTYYAEDFTCFNSATRTAITFNVSTCTSIKETLKEGTILIYPNPSKGLYHAELLTDAELTVTNILGEVISTQKMNAGTQTIDIQNQVNGVYFIKVSQNQQQQVIKLIKE